MRVPTERSWRRRKEIYSNFDDDLGNKRLRHAFAYNYYVWLKRKNQKVFSLQFERIIRRVRCQSK